MLGVDSAGHVTTTSDTVKDVVVTALSEPDDTASVYVPALSTERPANETAPLLAVAVAVPDRLADPDPELRATDTDVDESVATLASQPSLMSTVTVPRLEPTVTAVEGCPVTSNETAEPTVMAVADDVEPPSPGWDMSVVREGAAPPALVHTQQGSPISKPLVCPSPSESAEQSPVVHVLPALANASPNALRAPPPLGADW